MAEVVEARPRAGRPATPAPRADRGEAEQSESHQVGPRQLAPPPWRPLQRCLRRHSLSTNSDAEQGSDWAPAAKVEVASVASLGVQALESLPCIIWGVSSSPSDRQSRRQFIARTLATTGAVGLTAVLGGRAHATDLDPGVLGKLRRRLKRRLIVPADAGYDAARRVYFWNPATERRPKSSRSARRRTTSATLSTSRGRTASRSPFGAAATVRWAGARRMASSWTSPP